MRMWQEVQAVVSGIDRAKSQGEDVALATVVHIEGSAYRRPGARMVIFQDGETVGSISGGCLDEDVTLVAREVVQTGRPRLLRYDLMGDDDEVWGLNLGCHGIVEIFVEPLAGLSL